MNERTYKIYFEQFDENGQIIGYGVYHKTYKRYGNACRVAHKRYGDETKFKYWVETRNPWTEYVSEVTCTICGAKYTVPESVGGYRLAGQRIFLTQWTPLIKPRYKGNFPLGDVCSDCFDAVIATINSLKKGSQQ